MEVCGPERGTTPSSTGRIYAHFFSKWGTGHANERAVGTDPSHQDCFCIPHAVDQTLRWDEDNLI